MLDEMLHLRLFEMMLVIPDHDASLRSLSH